MSEHILAIDQERVKKLPDGSSIHIIPGATPVIPLQREAHVEKIQDEARGVEYQINPENGDVRVVQLPQEVVESQIS